TARSRLDGRGAYTWCPAFPAEKSVTGGSRLDHDEGAGEGPLAALRHGDRTGERRAAPSAKRAGFGRAAQCSVPYPEVRATAPVRRRRGGYFRSTPRR